MKKQHLKVLLISTFSVYLLVFFVGELLFNGSMAREFFLKKSDYYLLIAVPLFAITAFTVGGVILYFEEKKKKKT